MPDILQPELAALLLDVALGTLTQERRLTVKVISAVPSGCGDYRPHPVSKSALDLSWHIASSEIMFMDGVADGRFVYDPPRPGDVAECAAVVRWYRDRFPKSYSRLKRLPIENLTKPVDFRGMFQRPAVMFLHTAIRHTAHHRGQLSVYLRSIGVKVPPIYGASFDEPWPGRSTSPES